ITHVLAVRLIFDSQKDRGMSVLISSDRARPENFHEIARLSLIDIVEISTEPKLVKQTCGARAIGIPSAPHAFAVVLIPNDQALKSIVVETELTVLAQSLNGSDKHQIRRARTKTRPRRDDEKFPRLKICRRLQPNLCKMRNRIATALRHLSH